MTPPAADAAGARVGAAAARARARRLRLQRPRVLGGRRRSERERHRERHRRVAARRLDPLTGRAKQSPDGKLPLEGVASLPTADADGAAPITLEWAIDPLPDGVASLDSITSTGIYGANLVVVPHALPAGGTFTFRLDATYEGRVASASSTVVINRRPWGGAFELSYDAPAVALSTPITLSAGSSWTDDASDLPLSYSFAYAAADTADAPTPLGSAGNARVVTWKKPVAGNWTLYCFVSDALGARAEATAPLYVQEVKLDAAKLAELTNDMTRASAEGDAEGGTLLVTGFASTLNVAAPDPSPPPPPPPAAPPLDVSGLTEEEAAAQRAAAEAAAAAAEAAAAEAAAAAAAEAEAEARAARAAVREDLLDFLAASSDAPTVDPLAIAAKAAAVDAVTASPDELTGAAIEAGAGLVASMAADSVASGLADGAALAMANALGSMLQADVAAVADAPAADANATALYANASAAARRGAATTATWSTRRWQTRSSRRRRRSLKRWPSNCCRAKRPSRSSLRPASPSRRGSPSPPMPRARRLRRRPPTVRVAGSFTLPEGALSSSCAATSANLFVDGHRRPARLAGGGGGASSRGAIGGCRRRPSPRAAAARHLAPSRPRSRRFR